MLDGVLPPLIVLLATAGLAAVRHRVPRRRQVVVTAGSLLALLVLTAALERGMGRSWTYQHGPVRFWSGDIASDQNSQQVADPYTFTHVNHGILFYGLTQALMPAAGVWMRALLTIGAEASWEAYENTSTVVERYRAATISLGYFGDSVLNSMADIVACGIGFVLARRLPRRWSIAWVLVTEIGLAFWIRDNLTLNLVMLVHPFDVIRRWQSGLSI